MLGGDADVAARGVSDGLVGLVGEVVEPQAVTGRSQGGEMGAGARATHLSDSRTWPVHAAHDGGLHRLRWEWGSVCVCVCAFCERVQEVLWTKQGF